MGCAASTFFWIASGLRPAVNRSTSAVQMPPGQMAFTRIPLRAYSSAAVLVSWMTPPLEAE